MVCRNSHLQTLNSIYPELVGILTGSIPLRTCEELLTHWSSHFSDWIIVFKSMEIDCDPHPVVSRLGSGMSFRAWQKVRMEKEGGPLLSCQHWAWGKPGLGDGVCLPHRETPLGRTKLQMHVRSPGGHFYRCWPHVERGSPGLRFTPFFSQAKSQHSVNS